MNMAAALTPPETIMDTKVPALVSVQGVSKTYKTRRRESVLAIGKVTVDLAPEEFVSVIGPSGCGKSTLLHLVAGLHRPTTGDVLISGEDRDIRASEFGTVFQDPVLFPWRTIRKNLEMPAEVLGIPKETYKPRAQELLELVGLGACGDMYPQELSGGMQQRASIARAMIHDPKLLLMDEPFGAVDAITRENLNIELQRIRLASRKSILFVTHSISEAVYLSDRIIVMSARPSQVTDIVNVNLGTNRTPDVMATPEFNATVQGIHKTLAG